MEKTDKPKKSNKKIDEKMINQVLTYVRQGNYVASCCRAVGITPGAWTQLCTRRPEIKVLTEKAYYEAECNAVTRIIEAGHDDDPKYLMWFLERKFPERWSMNTKNQIEKLQDELKVLKESIAKIHSETNQGNSEPKKVID